MKKCIAILTALVLCLSMAACAPKENKSPSDGEGQSEDKNLAGNNDPSENEDPTGNDGQSETEDPAGNDDPSKNEDPAGNNDPSENEDPAGNDADAPESGIVPGMPVFPIPGTGGEDGSEGSDTPSINPGLPSVSPDDGGSEDIPVADAGDLVDALDAICQGIVEGSYTETLRDSASFANYFGGSLQYTEGMRVATNHLQMAPPAHIIMLIEVPEGKDPQDFAKELEDNANPRWLFCAVAESVQTAVKDNLVLFVMSNEETANAVIAAFNG